MGRSGKLPIGEQPSYNVPDFPSNPLWGLGRHPAPKNRAQRLTGANAGHSCALSTACRNESDVQLFSLCLGVLPRGGEFQLRQPPFVVTVEGLPEGQNVIAQTAVAPDSVPGHELCSLCADETALLQCAHILCNRVDREAQRVRDGGVADDALVSAPVLDADEVCVDVELVLVQLQLKDRVGEQEEILLLHALFVLRV